MTSDKAVVRRRAQASPKRARMTIGAAAVAGCGLLLTGLAAPSSATLSGEGGATTSARTSAASASVTRAREINPPFVSFPLAVKATTEFRDLNVGADDGAGASETPTPSVTVDPQEPTAVPPTQTGTPDTPGDTGSAPSEPTQTDTGTETTRPTTTASAAAGSLADLDATGSASVAAEAPDTAAGTAGTTPSTSTGQPSGDPTPSPADSSTGQPDETPTAAPEDDSEVDPSTGADYAVKCGTDVLAATPGRIILTPAKWAGGTAVRVYTSKLKVVTWYGHLSKISVTDGQIVLSGQKLGESGKAGVDADCRPGQNGQLHFEVRSKGGAVNADPTAWLNSYMGKPVPGGKVFGSRGFRISTFNVLGYSHTAPGGKAAGLADGKVRMGRALRLFNRYGVDVVGLQEFQRRQRAYAAAKASNTFGFYPFSSKAQTENSIIWRRSSFEYVDGDTFAVPYFNGRIRQMPWVKLRQKSTGREAYFINVHNPADTRKFRRQQRHRDAAVAREIDLIAKLRRTGDPVFITGDFNDQERAYCPITTKADMLTPVGSSPGSTCRPPAPAAQRIDMIFATDDGATFSRYKVDRSVLRRISDHAFVIARAHLTDK